MVFEWATEQEWNQFFDGYKEATACLRHLLSPRFPGSTAQSIDLDQLQPPTQLTTLGGESVTGSAGQEPSGRL
jgi:hypothetical protein